MALTKETTFKQLTIAEDGQVEVKWVVKWLEDGVSDIEQGRFKRYDVEDDVTGLPTIGQNVCAAAWTPAVVQNRLDAINALLVGRGEPAEATLAEAKAALAAFTGLT